MNTGVIGYGVVGGATAELLRRLGHRVMVRDSSSAAADRAKADGFDFLGPETELEVVFLCVPEAEVPGTVNTISGSPVTVVLPRWRLDVRFAPNNGSLGSNV